MINLPKKDYVILKSKMNFLSNVFISKGDLFTIEVKIQEVRLIILDSVRSNFPPFSQKDNFSILKEVLSSV